MSWNAEKFRLWAEIDLDQQTTVELDLIRVSARFALNDIPKASLTVALGRKVDDNKPSPIHRILSRLRVKRKVRVYCEAKTIGFFGLLGVNQWPKGKFLVFEGYTLGQGYVRTTNSAEYTLELEHWLADLAYASAVSAVSSPTNPANMTFSALTGPTPESAEGTAKSGGYTGLTKAEGFVTKGTISSDFWGDAVQPFFIGLTREETFVGTDAAFRTGVNLGPSPEGNEAARAALERFEPKVAAPLYSKKLKFDPAAYGGDLRHVAEQIEIALGSETLEMLAGSTLWDKLVQYAGTYLFAVSPMVERALVVPLIPGLRKEWLTITADQYEYVRVGGDTPRVLRGVGIYGGKNLESGSELAGDDAVDYDSLSVGGYFEGARTGQILFKQAPMWMSSLNLSSESGRASGGDGLPRGDALNPGEGEPPDDPKPKVKAEANARLMDQYARTMYVYEVLKQRSGDLAGKLRFDIGPGSVVKIEGAGEKFLGVDDQFGQTMFATVLQVEFHFDAEAPRAGTSFHLAHWRNEEENGLDGFSLDKHPIWSEAWTGTVLQKLK